MSALSEIIASQQAPQKEGAAQAAPEYVPTGRLTTAQVIVAVANIGNQIRNIADFYQKLPDAKPNDVDGLLESIINYSKSIIANAERLRNANK